MATSRSCATCPTVSPTPRSVTAASRSRTTPTTSTCTALRSLPTGRSWSPGSSSTRRGAGILRVERYLPDGQLDPTFGGSGIVTTTFGSDLSSVGVTVQADGKVVASVTVWVSPTIRFGLVRYTVDGAIDPTFGGGTRMYEFGTGGAVSSAVAIQGGGSPVPERIIEVGGHHDRLRQSQRHGGDPSPDGPPRTAAPPQPPPPPVAAVRHRLRSAHRLLRLPRFAAWCRASCTSGSRRPARKSSAPTVVSVRCGASSLGAIADESSRNHRAQASGLHAERGSSSCSAAELGKTEPQH